MAAKSPAANWFLRVGGSNIKISVIEDTGIWRNIGERLRAVRHLVQDEEIFLANYSDGLTSRLRGKKYNSIEMYSIMAFEFTWQPIGGPPRLSVVISSRSNSASSPKTVSMSLR
jgi:hypothetical protein